MISFYGLQLSFGGTHLPVLREGDLYLIIDNEEGLERLKELSSKDLRSLAKLLKEHSSDDNSSSRLIVKEELSRRRAYRSSGQTTS
jgi:hypothetical protein